MKLLDLLLGRKKKPSFQNELKGLKEDLEWLHNHLEEKRAEITRRYKLDECEHEHD